MMECEGLCAAGAQQQTGQQSAGPGKRTGNEMAGLNGAIHVAEYIGIRHRWQVADAYPPGTEGGGGRPMARFLTCS